MIEHRPREVFGIWLSQIARLWRVEINRRLLRFGLTEARWLTLVHLSRLDKPVTQRELAEAVGVRGPTLVRTLDWLEAEGLVERQPAPGDRRAKSLHLTDKAAPNLQRIQVVAASVRAEILAGVSDADIDICVQVFEHIAGKLGGAAPTLRSVRSITRRTNER